MYEVINMSGLLLELVEPLIQERERSAEIRGRKEGRREGIIGTVDALQKFGHNYEEIKTWIMKNYDLSEEEAEKYL